MREDRACLSLPAVEVAPRLLGCRLRHLSDAGTVTVEITEVEAYGGVGADPASHAHGGRTLRNDVMFGEPGRLYVYFVYGMHWCLNVVTGEEGTASAVLIRAGDVVEGLELARARRPGVSNDARLARGPANLAVALGITGLQNGVDLLAQSSAVRLVGIAQGGAAEPAEVVVSGPRVGIRQAADRPWRWWLAGRGSVSRPRSIAPDTPR